MNLKSKLLWFNLVTILALSSVVLGAEKSGAQLYETYCAACHGISGEGDPRWPQLDEKGDMTSPPHNEKGHTWRHSNDELVQMTLMGFRDPYNKTDFLNMPPFEGILTSEQIVDILEYIKQWWTPKQIKMQQQKK